MSPSCNLRLVMSTVTLPPGYTVRPPTPDDFDAVLAVIVAADIADVGKPDYDESDLRDDWKPLDLERDTRVVVAGGGVLAGYGTTSAPRSIVHMNGHIVVSPEHLGRGIGTLLTRWSEERARERIAEAPESARVSLGHGTVVSNTAAVDLLRHEGYEIERYFLRMSIELDETPAAPVLPDGMTIRTFVTGQDDRATHRAVDESFRDHWNHVSEPFDAWRAHAVERENFDPTLWFLAVESGEVAAAALCANFPDLGFVNTLGVRRAWRKSGVGLALLHAAFGEFYRRGQKHVSLGVDAQSLTGATRLYERAGMHEQRKYAIFTKELRTGVELGTRDAG